MVDENRCRHGETEGHTYCDITGAWCGYLSDDHASLQKTCPDFDEIGVAVEECRSKKCRELLKETKSGKNEYSVIHWCDVVHAPLRTLRACPKDECEDIVDIPRRRAGINGDV